jgi:hypothetical protein
VPGVCDSCGDEVDDVVAVHRIYVTPDADGKLENVDVMRDIELWCFPCRTHYPHEVIVGE